MFPTDKMRIEIKNVPQRAANIAIILPKDVFGYTSPKPTVVMVITINQIDVK